VALIIVGLVLSTSMMQTQMADGSESDPRGAVRTVVREVLWSEYSVDRGIAARSGGFLGPNQRLALPNETSGTEWRAEAAHLSELESPRANRGGGSRDPDVARCDSATGAAETASALVRRVCAFA
jgi:hypothetical protein